MNRFSSVFPVLTAHVPHVHEVLDRATADDLDPLEQHEDGTHAHGVDDVPGEGWGWGWGVGCQ